MEDSKIKISANQAFSILLCITIGAGVISISRNSVRIIRDAVWLPILVIGLIHIIEAYWLAKIIKRYSGTNSLDLLQKIVGKPGAIFLLLIIFLVFMAILILELVVLLDLTASTITSSTPQWFVLGSFMLSALYLVHKGLKVMARFYELLVPIILFLIFFIVIIAIFRINLINLMPADLSIREDAFPSIIAIFVAYSGPINIIFIYPYLEQRKKVVRVTLLSVVFVIGSYLSVGLATVGALGAGEVEHLMWPSLELTKAINTSGVFIHRLDFMYVILWIVTIFTTTTAIYFATVRILTLLFKVGHNFGEFVIALIIAIGAHQIYYNDLSDRVGEVIGIAAVLLGIALPLFLQVGSLIRTRLGRKGANDEG